MPKLCNQSLHSQCRGEDDRALNFSHQRKSVSAEVNYGIRFKTQQEADLFIRQLAVEVQTRLAEVKMKGRCITLKLLVRHYKNLTLPNFSTS